MDLLILDVFSILVFYCNLDLFSTECYFFKYCLVVECLMIMINEMNLGI